MLPHVIVHNAVSLDGRIEGFPVDLDQYYNLAASWKEDATLAGSDTILKAIDQAPSEDRSAPVLPEAVPDDTRAILVITDSRGRIRAWHYLRILPYWRHFVALCSESTPDEYIQYLKERHVDCIVTGNDHVDLRTALEELSRRYDVRVIRVDAGGTLNGQLLQQGLVDEVSLLVHPFIVGDKNASLLFLPSINAAVSETFAASDNKTEKTSASSISSNSFRATDFMASPVSSAPSVPSAPSGSIPSAGMGGVTSPEGPVSLSLTGVERLEGDIVWLRYKVNRERCERY